MLQEWLTVPEVARLLRVDPTTIRRWISLGILPTITLPHAGPRQTYHIHHTTLTTLLSQKPPHDPTIGQDLPHS